MNRCVHNGYCLIVLFSYLRISFRFFRRSFIIACCIVLPLFLMIVDWSVFLSFFYNGLCNSSAILYNRFAVSGIAFPAEKIAAGHS